MSLPDTATLRSAARNAAACATRLRLPLGSRVWRGASGDLSGHGSGSSMDFHDHRPYFPGDDPRHMNWQAYARTGTHTMKLFRQDVRPTIDILFDASPSMFLTPEKALRSCELLHFAFESAMRCGAAFSIYALLANKCLLLPTDSMLAANWVSFLQTGSTGSTDATHCDPAILNLRPAGLRVFISDLLFPGDPSPWTRALTQSKGNAVLLAPYDLSESAPEWSGHCDLIDVESGISHDRFVSESDVRTYQAAYHAHFLTWSDAAIRNAIPLARIPSNLTLDKALVTHALPMRAVEATV